MTLGRAHVGEYDLVDPLNRRRTAEPVFFPLPEGTGFQICAVLGDGDPVPVQMLPGTPRQGVAILDLPAAEHHRLRLFPGVSPFAATRSIKTITPTEFDGVVRLHTGTFELELCRGTARGTTDSKWGIRHFIDAEQGIDLIPGGDNALGGVYAPFFTPENGLINPPEHAIADVTPVIVGPLLHRYRMQVRIPDGLRPELRGALLSIDWTFTAGTRWFERHYLLSDFETEIDGRSVVGKLTVGDEFEAGKGNLVFDRFATAGATTFREGAPYSAILARAVQRIVANIDDESTTELRMYREAIGDDLASANWDWYWRLFSAWEKFLPHERIHDELASVRAEAHRASDAADRFWKMTTDPLGVDVPAALQSTVFVGPADRSAGYSTETGYGMVWWTSKPSGGFDIQQRRESGWCNWGTNTENERPELPNDVTIRTAYGRYGTEWQEVADELATPLAVRSIDAGVGSR